MLKEAAERVSSLTRWRKRAVVMSYDALALALALWLAFCVRIGTFYWPDDDRVAILGAASVVAGLGALLATGVYRVVIRYLDIRAASRIAVGAAGAAALWFVLAFLSKIEPLPRSVGFIYFGLGFLLMFFGRLAASHFLTDMPGAVADRGEDGERRAVSGVAIFGANAAGCALAESLRRQPGYKVQFFVDDNPAMLGRMMLGLPVKGSGALGDAVRGGAVDQVLLALPSASRSERLAAMGALSGLSVKVLTVPSFEEIMTGRLTVSDIRPVKVEDLLQRDIVPPKGDLIQAGVEARSILITGAGGSIGSEICRQVLRHSPRRMVLLDHSEFALYSIEAELQKIAETNSHLVLPEVVPVVGSLLSERLIARILRQYEVDTVFHAAAYKHVPLLESNAVIGVENNVLGTRILADACVAAGVSRLTMISTDKAVRPANVMGASKRMAELYIQALAREPGMRTCFGIVRFGNVLDSSGSVVQQFRKQIQAGGPVTVTHPDITRFFMSIPEATQLVLQANSLAKGGEVFVLDMGEPVKIAELARTMISLSGLSERSEANPHGDIAIDYVGLRPGEKLYEELFIGDTSEDTVHPQIKMARERCLPLEEMQLQVRRLAAAIAADDEAQVRHVLKNLLAPEQRLAA